ncbi:LPS export ABC transporter periplasmic protein LptC [Mesorhizobium sp. ASY16-5R]|uniref:LPS export ABC transporter periplasmic protein LptC n=1 Tax=Mesorhizobium sp. ASY16-5R TaxID=3445772 RepID=UPI003FA15639
MLARSPDTTDASTQAIVAPGGSAAERSAMFHNAARHSRIVGVLKIALPSLALIMAAIFIFQSYRSTPLAEITAEDTAVSEGKLVMASPKLEGFTNDNRPYSVSALRAVQDIANDAVVELQEISATVPVDATRSAKIETARGLFDRMTNILDIKSEINITTSDGAVARLASALLDMGAGRMSSDQPVEIHYKGGSISSDTMSVEDRGKVVVFDKRVRVHIVLPKKDMASQ